MWFSAREDTVLTESLQTHDIVLTHRIFRQTKFNVRTATLVRNQNDLRKEVCMKLTSIVLATAIGVLGTADAESGRLFSRFLAASYPLHENAMDATGKNAPINLVNAPFRDGGVYSNGVYIQSYQPDACLIETPRIEGLNFDLFAISVDFKVSERPPFLYWPVFVGGRYYRWLGFNLSSDGTVALLFNNDNIVPSKVRYSLDRWHTATVVYSRATRICRFFLDFRQAGRVKCDLVDGDDKAISNSNFSNGETFKGVLRNVRVYSAPSEGWLFALLFGEDLRNDEAFEQRAKTETASPDISVYPNPFNPSTTMRFELPTGMHVRLKIYDMSGREVRSLVDEPRAAGVHEVRFNGASLSSGVYVYKFQAGDFIQTKRLILLK